MIEERPSQADIIALGLLKQFPPSLRSDIANVPSFRNRFGKLSDVVFGFNNNKLSIRRSVLYAALRSIYVGNSSSVSIRTVDKRDAVILHRMGKSPSVIVKMGGECFEIPTFEMLSPKLDQRREFFAAEIALSGLTSEEIAYWQQKIDSGPLTDDEVDNLYDNLTLTPQGIVGPIQAELRRPEASISALIPDTASYYVRLVGSRANSKDLQEFAQNAEPNIQWLLSREFFTGLSQCVLFCASPHLTRNISLSAYAAEDVEKFFRWVSIQGDRWSQIAALEIGLRALPTFPSIEAALIEILQIMRDEDVSAASSRFRLTASLFIFTDGELVRAQTLKGEPPFWRRLASIAHAAIIEREIVSGSGANDPELWTGLRSENFYLQTLIDLRLEPRWLPDLMTAEQLRIEFLSRARIVAEEIKEQLPDGQLRELLLGSGVDSISHHLDTPFAFLPSPVEGACLASVPFPQDLLADLREPDKDKPLNAKIFAGVVNLALIFDLNSEIPDLIVGVLRKVKFRLTFDNDTGISFALLAGLAVVAAVARSPELANELRILARVCRRRGEVDKSSATQMRIALVACASTTELEPWCAAVGDWLLELASEDIDRQEAIQLRRHLTKLCAIEPKLWNYTSKAEAALTVLSNLDQHIIKPRKPGD